jgi:integrase
MTFHALRHCHKTWMTEDQSLESIQDYRLGHATPGIRARYTHRNLDMQKDITAGMHQRYIQSAHDYTHLSPALHSAASRHADEPRRR